MSKLFDHSCGPNSQPSSPDLAAIAVMLANAAQALLTLSSSPLAERQAKQPDAAQEQIRCYRFPALAVQCERELFQEQGAESLQEALFSASSTLNACFGADRRGGAMKGHGLPMLGRQLKRVGKALFKIQDAYSTVELVEA